MTERVKSDITVGISILEFHSDKRSFCLEMTSYYEILV